MSDNFLCTDEDGKLYCVPYLGFAMGVSPGDFKIEV